jgi:hypothetical protein
VTHRYRAYGLHIASELAIPELLPDMCADGGAEVEIRLGEVPERLASPVQESTGHQSGPEGMLLTIPQVARYFVSDGRHVVVSPDPAASDHDVRVFLLGTCFGALLHQRGALVLHASGIATGRGAVLFAGHSGAGKSTLLAEMLRRGYRMMVDDVCAILPADDGGLVVQPSYPRTRLWADSAAHLDVDTTGLQRTRSHLNKYERQVPQAFHDAPQPPHRIYHLTPAPEGIDVPVLTPVPPLAVVPLLVADTYRKVFLDSFGVRRRHFEIAGRVARTVHVVHLTRPRASFRLDELADLVVADMGED